MVAAAFTLALAFTFGARPAQAVDWEYEVAIVDSMEAAVDLFKSRDFWGESNRGEQLQVPPIVLSVMSERWRKEANKLPVDVKKEMFYRAMVPLVLHSNDLILRDRADLERLTAKHRSGKAFSAKAQAWLTQLGSKYGVDDPASDRGLDELLLRVDIVPASMALGQAAYESGYGTSRFAFEGNAFFGQWTFGGKGMRPKEHRAEKGDYGLAAFEWPFDSVRAYMRNLNTHRAYADFRKQRADLRRRGEPLSGTVLAGGMLSYSERGEKYVKTLRSMIRVNGLEVADRAQLKEEPPVFMVGVADAEEAAQARKRLEELRASGELDDIIRGMRLDES